MRAIDLDVATLTMVKMRTKELIRTPGRKPSNDPGASIQRRFCAGRAGRMQSVGKSLFRAALEYVIRGVLRN
jgi:hypothetical protein